MILESIELEILWEEDLTIFDLREHILKKIQNYGTPLRWAITSVKLSDNALQIRKLVVEGVVVSA